MQRFNFKVLVSNDLVNKNDIITVIAKNFDDASRIVRYQYLLGACERDYLY